MRKVFLFVIAALLPVGAIMAQQQMPTLPNDPAVKVGKLDNGLTYYIRHNEKPAQRAEFYLATNVGAIQETPDQDGLAHFLEHMCFNGTTHFPGDRLKQYLERIGVRFGENLNAYTSYDETVYNINNVNVETAGAVDSCMLILHDWSHDLLLEDKEIDKERGVINEEWRLRRTAQQRMQEAAFRDLFAGCRYAERSPIGTMDIVMNFPYESLRSYYRRWYRPDLQGLVIVGDVDVDAVESRLKEMFADIEASAAPADRADCPVPDNKETIVSIQKDKEFPMSYVSLMFKQDAMPRDVRGTMTGVVFDYMCTAVEHMFAERMREIMNRPDAPFLQAALGVGDYIVAKTKDAVSLDVVCKEGQYAEGLAAAYRELLRVQRGGFTAAEYERFKTEYLSQIEAAYNGRDKVENAAYVSEYVRHFLDNDPAPGIEWEHTNMPQLAAAIPLEVINKQMSAAVTPENRALLVFLPDKEGVAVPTAGQLTDALAAVDGEEIEALEEEEDTRPLVPGLAAGASVRSIKDGVYGSKVITLGNGMRIHALSTDYSPNSISFRAVSWGGTSLYDDSEFFMADNVGLVSLGGWGDFTATELNKKLSGIQAQAVPGITSRTESISASCVRKDFETMLQLIYLCFTAPHRDDDAFASARERVVQMLRNQDLNPAVALQDSTISVFYGNHPRAMRPRSEDMEAVSYDRLLEIYRERFANAGDFDFYLVGDFDTDSIAPLLARYLGALPAGGKAEKSKTISMRLAKGGRTCMFRKEQDTPSATVVFNYHAPMKYNLRNRVLASFLEQAMQMLYTETVREDEGGAYGVPVSVSASDYPEAITTVTVRLPTAPDKMERMMKVVDEGVEKMASEGPSDDYVQKIREYMLRSHAENLKDNGYWMRQLIRRTREKCDDVKDFDKVVQGITADDVRAFAARIFRSGNRLVVGMSTPAAE